MCCLALARTPQRQALSTAATCWSHERRALEQGRDAFQHVRSLVCICLSVCSHLAQYSPMLVCTCRAVTTQTTFLYVASLERAPHASWRVQYRLGHDGDSVEGRPGARPGAARSSERGSSRGLRSTSARTAFCIAATGPRSPQTMPETCFRARLVELEWWAPCLAQVVSAVRRLPVLLAALPGS